MKNANHNWRAIHNHAVNGEPTQRAKRDENNPSQGAATATRKKHKKSICGFGASRS
jgi:hypothetical protein